MIITRYKLALYALGLAAILLAPILIIPQDLERAIVLKSDGYQNAAHSMMQDLYRGGERSETLVYELAQQKLDFGEIEIAGKLLTDYSAGQPDLVWPRTELLGIRQSFGTEEERMNALLAVHADEAAQNTVQDPTARHRNLKILAEHYRITGNHDLEAEIIEDAISSGTATADETFRLGVIKAAAGQLPSAIAILQSIDDDLPDHAVRQRLTLYSMLISAGRPLDAFQYAQTWRDRRKEPLIDYELKQIMLAYGYPDIASGFSIVDPVIAEP